VKRWLRQYVAVHVLVAAVLLVSGCDERARSRVEDRAMPSVPASENLQTAIDAAPSGGTVRLGAGTYTVAGGVTISKPLTLLGDGSSSKITATSGSSALLTVRGADGVTISGITFDGGAPGHEDGASIDLLPASPAKLVTDVRIEDNRFLDTPATAIGLNGAHRVRIIANHFANLGGSAVRGNVPTFDTNQDVLVERNTIRRYDLTKGSGNAAIQTDGAAIGKQLRWRLHDNLIDDSDSKARNGVGIGLDYISDSVIEANRVQHTLGEGIVVTGPHNVVSGNTVSDASSGCIMLYATSTQPVDDNLVIGNTAYDCAHQGIALVFANSGLTMRRVRIQGNRVYDNGSGNTRSGIQAYYGGDSSEGAFDQVVIADNDSSGVVGPRIQLADIPGATLSNNT
jgi:nitrous oxidase accessory protein NosD